VLYCIPAVPGQNDAMNFLPRRKFLTTLGSVTFWPKALQATQNPIDQMRFIVIADTHLGRRDNDQAERQWRKTAAELKAAPGDFILHLGDVVDGGRAAQYPIYRRIRDGIGKPVHEIPGNHDPRALFEKHLEKPADRFFVRGRIRFVLLNNAHSDSHDGFITDKQLAWIEAQCSKAQAQGQFIIFCLHVPVHANKHPDRGWYVKPQHGQKPFYEICRQYRDRVVATFHGHFHNGIRGWDDHGSLHEIIFPSALYNLNRRLEEQKAPGYNLNEFRPGYTLVALEGRKMTLKYKPAEAKATAEKQFDLPVKT
jgi:predicted phosphodiesterase